MKTLQGRARIKRTMWSRRAQEYEAKINSGDLVSIAEVVREDEISESYIVPSVFNQTVAKHVSAAVIRAAVEDGVARKVMSDE